MAGLSESYLRKGPLDADKSIAETLNGQIIDVLRIYTAEQRNFSDDEYKLISGLAAISVMIVLLVAGHMIVD